MNPPPPMFPALGWTTASANAVATAASTALPPLASIDAPTSEAMPLTETTSPDVEATGGGPAGRGPGWDGTTRNTAPRMAEPACAKEKRDMGKLTEDDGVKTT